jgi:hypothetical protein
MRNRLSAFILTGALVLSAAEVLASQHESSEYELAIRQVCRDGVTPAMLASYEQLIQVLSSTNSGFGQNSNFFGPRPPWDHYTGCARSGGADAATAAAGGGGGGGVGGGGGGGGGAGGGGGTGPGGGGAGSGGGGTR